MPLYEYRCEGCGEMEEKLQSMRAPESHDCPKCGKADGMKRQVSVASFNLVGGGWYKSGYSQASQPAAPEKPTGTEGGKPGGGCCGNCSCHG